MSLFGFLVKAQQPHFVYLQTDNGQPFYLKLNNKVISSSAQGYVILPNIADGEYQITVGFPKKEHPEKTFTINIDNDNEGFLIKNFEDNGTQLFNLETLALINGASDSSKPTVAYSKKDKDTDAFSTMLANVVKDSSILQNHQIQALPRSEVKIDSAVVANKENAPTAPAAPKTDTSVVAEKAEVSTAPIVAKENPVKNDSVSKLLSNESTSGLTMLYEDKNADKTDTVSVFIPSQNAKPETENTDSAEKRNDNISSSTVPVTNINGAEGEKKNDVISSSTGNTDYTITPTAVTSKDSTGFVFRKDSVSNTDSGTRPVQVFTIGPVKDKPEKKVEDEKPNDATVAKVPKAEVLLLPKVVTSSRNSDCRAFATNEDFLRLRKKMASENNQDDMIKAAGKYFKSKCFSTEQIKDLSYLFLTEEGKYMFFDAAYAHTSDSDQYETLESQFTDPYYLNRFKAMLH